MKLVVLVVLMVAQQGCADLVGFTVRASVEGMLDFGRSPKAHRDESEPAPPPAPKPTAAQIRAQAIQFFEIAVAATTRDECDLAKAAMHDIQAIDRPYYDTVADDVSVAWCTASGRGASREVTRLARDYAVRGDCQSAVELAHAVLGFDRAYYARVYQQRPEIVACWRTALTLPARVTDATSMQLATQARNAARRLDCAGANAALERMSDREYRDAFVASPAFEACR